MLQRRGSAKPLLNWDLRRVRWADGSIGAGRPRPDAPALQRPGATFGAAQVEPNDQHERQASCWFTTGFRRTTRPTRPRRQTPRMSRFRRRPDRNTPRRTHPHVVPGDGFRRSLRPVPSSASRRSQSSLHPVEKATRRRCRMVRSRWWRRIGCRCCGTWLGVPWGGGSSGGGRCEPDGGVAGLATTPCPMCRRGDGVSRWKNPWSTRHQAWSTFQRRSA